VTLDDRVNQRPNFKGNSERFHQEPCGVSVSKWPNSDPHKFVMVIFETLPEFEKENLTLPVSTLLWYVLQGPAQACDNMENMPLKSDRM